MRIGIDARLYSTAFTGIGRYVFELVNNLIKLDTQNEYVLFFNNPEYENFSLAGSAAPNKNVKKVLVDAKHYSLREQFHFLKILLAENLDLMHFTHFNAPILYRRPSVVTIHDLTLSFHPGKKMNKWWTRAAYHFTIKSIVHRAARVIAVSEHTKKDVVRLLKKKPAEITVIHEGVNSQFHKIADRNIIKNYLEKIGFAQPYLLYTGVWRSHKNLVNLIKAFAILKRKHRFDGTLVITGKEDPWYPEVQEAVKKEKLEGEVRFTGLVPDEDLVLLYNGAFAYIFPSLYEGFGLPALESFACGVPVCAANASSLPEICGDAALYFDPKDPADMAEKMAQICNNPDTANDLRKRGFERVKNFSWLKMTLETLALYLCLSQSKK